MTEIRVERLGTSPAYEGPPRLLLTKVLVSFGTKTLRFTRYAFPCVFEGIKLQKLVKNWVISSGFFSACIVIYYPSSFSRIFFWPPSFKGVSVLIRRMWPPSVFLQSALDNVPEVTRRASGNSGSSRWAGDYSWSDRCDYSRSNHRRVYERPPDAQKTVILDSNLVLYHYHAYTRLC